MRVCPTQTRPVAGTSLPSLRRDQPAATDWDNQRACFDKLSMRIYSSCHEESRLILSLSKDARRSCSPNPTLPVEATIGPCQPCPKINELINEMLSAPS
jgi:hypothetical protein